MVAPLVPLSNTAFPKKNESKRRGMLIETIKRSKFSSYYIRRSIRLVVVTHFCYIQYACLLLIIYTWEVKNLPKSTPIGLFIIPREIQNGGQCLHSAYCLHSEFPGNTIRYLTSYDLRQHFFQKKSVKERKSCEASKQELRHSSMVTST